jgi:hypothetical protein
MKQEIVLPKFKVPGQRNWLVTGLWIAGGLVLLQAVIVGAFLWRHQAKVEAKAAQAVLEKEQLAAALEKEKAVKPVRPSKGLAGKPVLTGQKPLVAKATPGAVPAEKPHARAGLRKKAVRQSKLFAKSPARARGAKPKAGGGKGGDAIDEILKKFK